MDYIWLFQCANIRLHRKLQNKQFMVKGRKVIYCWTEIYTPEAAHCVATTITSVHILQPSNAVQFIQSIQQHTFTKPCH
jgi:hypothetical protein